MEGEKRELRSKQRAPNESKWERERKASRNGQRGPYTDRYGQKGRGKRKKGRWERDLR